MYVLDLSQAEIQRIGPTSNEVSTEPDHLRWPALNGGDAVVVPVVRVVGARSQRCPFVFAAPLQTPRHLCACCFPDCTVVHQCYARTTDRGCR